MSNNDSKFSSKSVEHFFREVKSISYVLNGNSKIDLTNEYQYTDLLLLYEQNANRKPGDRTLFYKERDKAGDTFIRLTSVGAMYIKNNYMFKNNSDAKIISGKKLRTLNNLVDDGYDENVIESIDKMDYSVKKREIAIEGRIPKNEFMNISDDRCYDLRKFRVYNN